MILCPWIEMQFGGSCPGIQLINALLRQNLQGSCDWHCSQIFKVKRESPRGKSMYTQIQTVCQGAVLATLTFISLKQRNTTSFVLLLPFYRWRKRGSKRSPNSCNLHSWNVHDMAFDSRSAALDPASHCLRGAVLGGRSLHKLKLSKIDEMESILFHRSQGWGHTGSDTVEVT